MRADKKVSENPENLGSRRSWRSKIMNPITDDYWVWTRSCSASGVSCRPFRARRAKRYTPRLPTRLRAVSDTWCLALFLGAGCGAKIVRKELEGVAGGWEVSTHLAGHRHWRSGNGKHLELASGAACTILECRPWLGLGLRARAPAGSLSAGNRPC